MAASNNNNRISAVVLFQLIIPALLLFAASYPQSHALFFGVPGLPGLGGIIPPGLGGLIPPGLGGLIPPPLNPLPNVPLPPIIPLPTISPSTLIPSQLPAGINITGQLCCAPNGNCPVQGGGQGVPGVPVIINCTFPNGAVTIGGGTTGVSGTFSIMNFVPVVVQFLFSLFSAGGQLPCVAIVDQLQLINSITCPVLSTLNGTLASLLNATGTTINESLQTILTATLTGLVNVQV